MDSIVAGGGNSMQAVMSNERAWPIGSGEWGSLSLSHRGGLWHVQSTGGGI